MEPEESKDDLEQFMKQALAEAQRAYRAGEVPVGAVVVDAQGRILAKGHNRSIGSLDPTAHAEVVALREACAAVGNYRLPGATLFVTIEPCPLCAGACLLARIDRLVFGARDPKTGAVRSLWSLVDDPRTNHRIAVVEGVLAEECASLLQDFFRSRRS